MINDTVQFPGFNINLRKATLADRPIIYNWLAKSTSTKSMLGEPTFPDAPAPNWNEFVDDFCDGFFTDSVGNNGKCFIIRNKHYEIGTVCYDLMNLTKKYVLLDIWLKDEKYCGHGYGSETLLLLCIYLFNAKGIKYFYTAPSLRNIRAIKSYEKAGFNKLKMNRSEAKRKFGIDIFDYRDNVVMKKVIKESF